MHNLGAADLGTGWMLTFVEKNLLGLALAAIGIVIIFKAHKKDLGASATILSIALIGVVVIALGASGLAEPFGVWVVKNVFG